MEANPTSRVVFVHDWLNGMRGGEKCLEMVCRRWPDAPLFTLLHKPGTVSPVIEHRPLTTSWLQRLPAVHHYYRYLLPLMPGAAARWELPACDLVISFSHCVAKAARAPDGVPHVCYCFTPMRYAWHMRHAYFGKGPWPQEWLRGRLLERLRAWDQRTAAGVTHFVAISKTVQARIQECYGRSSVVIYPPVNTDFFCPSSGGREGYYLCLSAFAPYKRLDLAIGACNRLGRRLIVIGSGQEEKRLRALAGRSVEFLGWQSAEKIREHLRRCRALLFPGEEDFGIVPVEANACGAPVIAFGRGGATETLLPAGGPEDPTGYWFPEQTIECLAEAIEEFEAQDTDFNPAAARRQALRFTAHRFEEEFVAYLRAVLQPRPEARRAA